MVENKKLKKVEFNSLKQEVLAGWYTGKAVNLDEAVRYHRSLPPEKVFSEVLKQAEAEKATLLQPRSGVALVDEHIKLLKFLENDADLLTTTIDSYTRQNRYQEAARGIEKSYQAGRSLLNGFPAVNHGVHECRKVVDQTNHPVQIRHGTPDARLLAEITMAAGFQAFEGGGISYNIPYAKKVPPEKSIYDWQYVDRLVGEYQERGVQINREPFGPLSGTLVPPFISHAVAVIEGLLALTQGVKSITLGYGQGGNLVQDIAAMMSLQNLAHQYFQNEGYSDYLLTTVFHQWMGGFPEDEAKAFSIITWGGAAAAMANATKVIVKTPHEAMGVPTREANSQGLRATRQIINILLDQEQVRSPQIDQEVEVITREVECIMDRVYQLGSGDVARGAVQAIYSGVIDIPFAPSAYNRGKFLPIRDNYGAIRVYHPGQVPLDDQILDFHHQKLSERSTEEGRDPGFQMVIDDIYAISKGRLVGRPR